MVYRLQMDFSAITQRDGKWRIGGVQEAPAVNRHGCSRDELAENLRAGLAKALSLKRAQASAAAQVAFAEMGRASGGAGGVVETCVDEFSAGGGGEVVVLKLWGKR